MKYVQITPVDVKDYIQYLENILVSKCLQVLMKII